MDAEIVVGSSTLALTVVAHDGLGMAPLHRLTERGPMQHGATDVGYRLDPRVFSLVVALKGADRQDLYAQRRALQTQLSPGALAAVRLTLDDGSKRQIDCKVIDAPLPHDARREYAGQVAVLRFVAADPTLYDPTGKDVQFGLAGGSDAGEVPTSIPMFVGSSVLDQTVLVTYSGNFEALPWRVRIKGPITDPVIENLATGEKLDFTGYTLAGSEYYEIDCRYGRKAVIDQNGTNIISRLSDDSHLATFHLAPHPQVGGGLNNLRVTGTAVTESTEVIMAYYIRDLGI